MSNIWTQFSQSSTGMGHTLLTWPTRPSMIWHWPHSKRDLLVVSPMTNFLVWLCTCSFLLLECHLFACLQRLAVLLHSKPSAQMSFLREIFLNHPHLQYYLPLQCHSLLLLCVFLSLHFSLPKINFNYIFNFFYCCLSLSIGIWPLWWQGLCLGFTGTKTSS